MTISAKLKIELSAILSSVLSPFPSLMGSLLGDFFFSFAIQASYLGLPSFPGFHFWGSFKLKTPSVCQQTDWLKMPPLKTPPHLTTILKSSPSVLLSGPALRMLCVLVPDDLSSQTLAALWLATVPYLPWLALCGLASRLRLPTPPTSLHHPHYPAPTSKALSSSYMMLP